MNLLIAGFLGVVQGVTEFLPISSTGHLVVLQHFLGMDPARFGLAFNAALHLGTFMALVVFLWGELWHLLRVVVNLIKGRRVEEGEKQLLVAVILGTIPAAVFGVFLEDVIARYLETPIVVAVSLIIFSGVLWWVEKKGKRERDLEDVEVKDGWWVGLFQALALIPGVSRSGITIAAGMGRGMKREVAAKFGFLLSVPVILGAGGKEFLGVAERGISGGDLGFFVVGMVTATISGYAAVKWLVGYLRKTSLMPFVWYRVGLGLVLLLSLLLTS